MKPIVDEVARKLRDALRESMDDFEGLYVFGSQVRGDATEDSDVDIVVILGEDYIFWPKKFHDIFSKMLCDYYEKIELDIRTKTWESLKWNPVFFNEVVNNGVFYGRV